MRVMGIIIMVCGIAGGIRYIMNGQVADGTIGGLALALIGFYFFQKKGGGFKRKNDSSSEEK